MTTQEAYERIRAWLTRPGAKRAVNESGSGFCVYRTDDGEQKCAVGCLLSDEALTSLGQFQGGFSILKESYPLLVERELGDVDEAFLAEAQLQHDVAGNWTNSGFHVRALDRIAERHGLEVAA